jgi:hypothetical protein
MRLGRPRRWMTRRNTVQLAVDAYVAWRQECVAVRMAYLTWRRAGAAESADAFDAYEAALYREEMAANVCAKLIGRVGHVGELALARQLAYSAAAPGTWS